MPVRAWVGSTWVLVVRTSAEGKSSVELLKEPKSRGRAVGSQENGKTWQQAGRGGQIARGKTARWLMARRAEGKIAEGETGREQDGEGQTRPQGS